MFNICRIGARVAACMNWAAKESEMKATRLLAALGCLLTYTAGAQDSGASQGVKFDFGTTLNVVLSDSLDGRKNKPGDAVKAKVAEDVRAAGEIVIPRGAKLSGHLTQVQGAGQGDGGALLAMIFERAELKDGRQVPLHAAFYALAAPEGAQSDQGGPSSGGAFNSGGLGGGAASAGSIVSSAGHAATDDASALGAGASGRGQLKPSAGAIGGINSKGLLYASSRGVFGLEDLQLQPGTTPGGASSVILSTGRNVHLASGTRMLLSVESAATYDGIDKL
jgi:hypothetical protein